MEVKSEETAVFPQWAEFARQLPCSRGVQVTARPAWRVHDFGPTKVLVAGAAEALRYLT